MKLLVSSLEDMQSLQGKATHLLSIIDPEDIDYVLTLGIAAEKRLLLTCHDVDSVAEAKARMRDFPGSVCTAPTSAMVRKALSFAGHLTEEDTLLVHCGHGISRSTALAFAILCASSPDVSETEILRRLVEIRPQACPNILIVKLADQLLKRKGRMIRALATADP